MINFQKYKNVTEIRIPQEITLSTANFYNIFSGMKNLKTITFPKDKITDISRMCYFCDNLAGSPACGNDVINMSSTYYYCTNLTGSPVCGNNVTNMYSTYYGCSNLTGSPVCGDNVADMYSAYRFCYSLTGEPVCGSNVTNMSFTYNGCSSLTGSPVCGNKVTDMSYAYIGCGKLAGSPVCGEKVTSMYSTYENCYNLTGSPACGKNVSYMGGTYQNCVNLYGNMYMYSANVYDVRNCFAGRNTYNMLNIYVTANSTSQTTLMNYTNDYSIIGKNCTWTHDTTNNRYYNTEANIYIYPVENVAAARAVNGD